MAVTVEMLKEKIARVQQELDEVRAALDHLETPVQEAARGERAASETPAAPPRRDPLAHLRFSDPKKLLPILDRAFAEMGIDVTQPALSPVEVQELMLREGVRPEDNLGSRGIIEAREE
jgi:hypothetical protein